MASDMSALPQQMKCYSVLLQTGFAVLLCEASGKHNPLCRKLGWIQDMPHQLDTRSKTNYSSSL